MSNVTPRSVGDDSHSIHDLDDPSLRVVSVGEGIGELLGEMVRRGASDLILVPGAAPVVRVGGRLERLEWRGRGGGCACALRAPPRGPGTAIAGRIRFCRFLDQPVEK